MLRKYNASNITDEELLALTERKPINLKKIMSTVDDIFREIVSNGDEAIIRFTSRFDGVLLDDIARDETYIEKRADLVKGNLKKSIDLAYDNIYKYQYIYNRAENTKIETVSGVTCWRRQYPVDKVGLYIPGGSAPLFSTLLMLGIPAKIAGCSEIVVCTPPDTNGDINPAICYAAKIIGIKKIYCVGGAQAIAAMTVGTQSVPKVFKIFGPGNQFIMAAKSKSQEYGVAQDMPSGPSELLVIADKFTDPEFVAADLLSQAEHGPDSQVVLLTDTEKIYLEVDKQIKKMVSNLPRKETIKESLRNSFCIIFDSLEQALEYSNYYAPEHLIINTKKPQILANKVEKAGSVFLGSLSPESAGDYASGTNHCLPTGGWAKSYGGISVGSFCKYVSFQSLSEEGVLNLGETVMVMADAEGLEAHKMAMEIRYEKFGKK